MNFHFYNQMSAQCLQLPRWAIMWSLAITIYLVLKIVSWSRREPVPNARWRWWAYLLGWPGMDAKTFLNVNEIPVPRPELQEWLFAFTKLGFGIALLIFVDRSDLPLDPYFL